MPKPAQYVDPNKWHWRAPLTSKSARQYYFIHANKNDAQMKGYKDATVATIDAMRVILEKAQNFKELKKEIMNFRKDRTEFVNYYKTLEYMDETPPLPKP